MLMLPKKVAILFSQDVIQSQVQLTMHTVTHLPWLSHNNKGPFRLPPEGLTELIYWV
jgi:hypothetical protein